MARSTTWPRPPRCARPWSAARVRKAPASPAAESASAKLGRSGGPSASPLMATKPVAASAVVPKPGRSRSGPVWPKPVTRVRTSPGFRAASAS